MPSITLPTSTAAEAAPPSQRGRGRRSAKRTSRNNLTGYVFIAPAVILFLLMGLYTLVYGFLLSFATWNGFTPTWKWVGLDNYIDLLGGSAMVSPVILNAAVNTLWVIVGLPVITVVISFPLAILLNSINRFAGAIRTIFFLPYVTAGIAVFYAWTYVLQPQGAINSLLTMLGLGTLSQPQGWLGNPDTALPTLIVVMVWSAVPVAMILYLSALQSVDTSLIEAASIDGAGWWRTNFSITWPLVAPITAVVVLLNIREALQGFQTMLLMTNGGPAEHTNVLGLEAYRLAFLSNLAPTLGLSSALSWLLFAAAIILAFVNLRLFRSKT